MGLPIQPPCITMPTGRLFVGAIASKLDLQQGLNVLLQPDVHKVSIADPAHVPYDSAAVAALQHENLYEKVKAKLVLGENISQAAQFVQSGNAT